jgi:hypothetical protein
MSARRRAEDDQPGANGGAAAPSQVTSSPGSSEKKVSSLDSDFHRYVYDPAANSWTADPLPFPKELAAMNARGGLCYNALCSPELNAHFIHCAGDSHDKGTMWVYRYKRAKKK